MDVFCMSVESLEINTISIDFVLLDNVVNNRRFAVCNLTPRAFKLTKYDCVIPTQPIHILNEFKCCERDGKKYLTDVQVKLLVDISRETKITLIAPDVFNIIRRLKLPHYSRYTFGFPILDNDNKLIRICT